MRDGTLLCPVYTHTQWERDNKYVWADNECFLAELFPKNLVRGKTSTKCGISLKRKWKQAHAE